MSDILYVGAIDSRTFVPSQSACSGFDALYFGRLVVLTMSCRRRVWHWSSSHNFGVVVCLASYLGCLLLAFFFVLINALCIICKLNISRK